MYDNLPFTTEDRKTILAFLESDLLTYKDERNKPNKETGEQIRTSYFKYTNLTIAVEYNEDSTPIRLTSRGSFHYLMNKGKHNADAKNFQEARDFLIRFSELLKIDLQMLKILPAEFAVNVPIEYDPAEVVKYCFVEQRKLFTHNTPGQPSKISGKVSNDYRLKIYSKWHEFPKYCQPNILRMEYQAKKMRALNRLGVVTLHDLLEVKNWIKIKELHLSYFRHLVLYDYLIKLPRNSKYKKNIVNYSTPIYWENLITSIKNKKEYDTRYNEEVSNLRKLSFKYGADILTNVLLCADNQWNKFLNLCIKSPAFEIKKLKIAPLYKTKDAPFIVCRPCSYYQGESYTSTGTPDNTHCDSPINKIVLSSGKPKNELNKKLIIKNYAVNLFNKNLSKYKLKYTYTEEEVKYYSVEIAENIAKNTVQTVRRRFSRDCKQLNLNIWTGKFFVCPLGSVNAWDKETLLMAFRSRIYQKESSTNQILP